MLGSLPERDRRVLELRYGLNGQQPCTLEEVGRQFGVTRERIRQIENNTLKRLETLPESQGLRDATGQRPRVRRRGRSRTRPARDLDAARREPERAALLLD